MSLKARILVGLVGAVGTLFAAILFFYAASPYVEKGVVPFFHSAPLEALIFGTAGIACLIVSIRLIAGRRWTDQHSSTWHGSHPALNRSTPKR